MTMTPHLVDASGQTQDQDEKKSAKQIVFDYSGIVAAVGVAVAWGVLSNSVQNNGHEIERLRAANDARTTSDIRIASEMATRADVQKVSDQVQALASELRNARGGK